MKKGKSKPAARSTKPDADKEKVWRGLLPKEIQAKILAGFYRPADLENYSKTFQLYLRGKAVGWQEAKLEKLGWIKLENHAAKADPEKSHDPDDLCDTYQALAKRLLLYYQNADGSNKLTINIDKKVVSDWAHGKRLGERQIWPPGPVEGARRKWSLKAWIAWFDETLWTRHRKDIAQASAGTSPEDDPLVLKQRVERQKLLDELWESDRLRGGYIAVPVVEAIFSGEMRIYHNAAKAIIEKNPPEELAVFAKTLDIAPEKIAALKEFVLAAGRKMVDELETEMLKRAAETAKQAKQLKPEAA